VARDKETVTRDKEPVTGYKETVTRYGFFVTGSSLRVLSSKYFAKLFFHSGISAPVAALYLSFEKTEYAGRGAGRGYSAVVIGTTLLTFSTSPRACIWATISAANSYQLQWPELEKW
jgi:hypothetical protein